MSVTPPLNEHEIDFLVDFNETRRMHRSGGPLFVKGEGQYGQGDGPDEIYNHNGSDPDQPGLWCQWVPSDDGTEIMWDEGEKFYNPIDWMEYVIRLLSDRAYIDAHVNEDERLKHFTCNHVVNGEIYADGEDSDDNWKLVVENNVVKQYDAQLTYGDEKPEVTPPTEDELKAALQSLGVGVVTEVKVWSLTIDTDSIVTQVFGSEQEVYDTLKLNFAETLEEEYDVTTEEGRSDMIEFLTERAAVVLYIDEHIVKVPA